MTHTQISSVCLLALSAPLGSVSYIFCLCLCLNVFVCLPQAFYIVWPFFTVLYPTITTKQHSDLRRINIIAPRPQSLGILCICIVDVKAASAYMVSNNVHIQFHDSFNAKYYPLVGLCSSFKKLFTSQALVIVSEASYIEKNLPF